MKRKRLCAGNWKMFKTASEAAAYVDRFLDAARSVPNDVELVICPAFTALQAARQRLAAQTRIRLGAQDMFWERQGAYTGEVSAPMLLDLGVSHVILGHSERRQYFGETDDDVRRKTRAALNAALTPIVAVGESLEIRDRGEQVQHVVRQTRAALDGLDDASIARCVLAYEPVWAIGTGKNCEATDANAIMGKIRETHPALQNVPILYGGSVKVDNIAQYAAQPHIDGALVGGASLDADGFAALAAQLSVAA